MNDLKFTTAGDYMKTNERIRILQLADQAYEEYETDTTKYEVNIPDEFCKKFAELIVRECTGFRNELGIALCNDPSALHRYFGVKE